MTRLSMNDLEALAFETGAPIEVDDAEGIAVLTRGREVFYAQLEPVTP